MPWDPSKTSRTGSSISCAERAPCCASHPACLKISAKVSQPRLSSHFGSDGTLGTGLPMLTVIVPAASSRLTTVARARALLGFSKEDNEAAEILIDKASEAIVEWCKRLFALESVR